MTQDIDPNDLAEIATILARGYLRHREAMRRRAQNPLASSADGSVHVPVVDGPEKQEESVLEKERQG